MNGLQRTLTFHQVCYADVQPSVFTIMVSEDLSAVELAKSRGLKSVAVSRAHAIHVSRSREGSEDSYVSSSREMAPFQHHRIMHLSNQRSLL